MTINPIMKLLKRTPVRNLGVIAILALILGFNGAAATPPNIVFIFADDMGYGDVQILNAERGKIKTPYMDALAREGMIFTDAHTSSSVCTPSRYSLMTGRYNWRSTKQVGVNNGFSQPLIPTDRETVASLLKKQGYNTGMIGKWHIGMNMPKGKGMKKTDWNGKIKGGPFDLGFDYYFGISASLDMPPYIYIENDEFVGECTVEKTLYKNRKGPAEPDFEGVKVLDDLAEKAVEFIGKQSAEKPFFTYIALPSPHTPIVPKPEWQGKSEIGTYGDFMMETDAFVGTIMKALDVAGFTENTMIIVSSDNGCSKAADIPAMQQKGHFPSAQLRGFKADLWDGGHRVPFIVRWPASIKAGSTSDAIICLTDFMATAAELSGATIAENAGEDSVSFAPELIGKEIETTRKGIIHHSINGSFAYREGKWKLLLASGSAGWTAPKTGGKGAPKAQLYDMEADIGETKNLYTSHPEVAARLLSQFESDVARGRSTEGADQSNDATVKLWKGKKK